MGAIGGPCNGHLALSHVELIEASAVGQLNSSPCLSQTWAESPAKNVCPPPSRIGLTDIMTKACTLVPRWENTWLLISRTRVGGRIDLRADEVRRSHECAKA